LEADLTIVLYGSYILTVLVDGRTISSRNDVNGRITGTTIIVISYINIVSSSGKITLVALAGCYVTIRIGRIDIAIGILGTTANSIRCCLTSREETLSTIRIRRTCLREGCCFVAGCGWLVRA
jgi:hypothetical protein